MSASTPHIVTVAVPADAAGAAPAKRKQLFGILAAAILLVGGGAGAYWFFVSSHYVTTDNAYSAAEVATLTPSVAGIVTQVNAVDTQAVKAGDVLVVIDPADARLALAQAEAELDRATRRVQAFFANDAGLRAQVDARAAEQRRAEADLLSARAGLQRAELDLKRREALAQSGSVSGEELSNARTSLLTAQAAMRSAEAGQIQAAANRAATIGAQQASTVLTARTTVEDNPEVALARAKRDQARLDLQRTVLRAPVDGVVARRQVQVGQRVQTGANLMSVVPVQQMHVDANFKEGQLTDVRVGQPATLVADLYGSKVAYHGVVTGIAGGSGAAFAMIPAQNATGNWIKVVQRVPVRVSINADELARKPLAVGLSMEVKVDVSKPGATRPTTAGALRQVQ
jgi:membrane fusion protein (multidrug efflux system)